MYIYTYIHLYIQLKARSHRPNGAGAVNKIHHRSIPFTTALNTLATIKATLYMLGHR